MVAQAPVAGETGRRRLPAAIHRDEVDVDVHEQIAVGRALVDLDLFALWRRTEERELVRGPRRRAATAGRGARTRRTPGRRGRGAVRPRSSAGASASAAMRMTSSTPASAARSSTASITRWRMSGRRIWWQRQADVVERDRQFHAREQQRGQRFGVDRVFEQRVANRAVDVLERASRVHPVDDAASAGGQLLQAETLAAPEHDRWGRCGRRRGRIRGGAWQLSGLSQERRSKATFTAPRRPAAAACARASV